MTTTGNGQLGIGELALQLCNEMMVQYSASLQEILKADAKVDDEANTQTKLADSGTQQQLKWLCRVSEWAHQAGWGRATTIRRSTSALATSKPCTQIVALTVKDIATLETRL